VELKQSKAKEKEREQEGINQTNSGIETNFKIKTFRNIVKYKSDQQWN